MEENHKRISECQLPQEIIHHIQSFLDEKKAAHTTLISKQWHGAWSTRPNLNFDQRHFRRNDFDFDFEGFTKKTMQRYEDRNLNIHSLCLRIKFCKDYSLAAKLTRKAIKLGAADIDIGFSTNSRKPFVLADEVFQSETLTRLSVDGCKIGIQKRRKKEVTTSSNLKSLTLSDVYDTDENIIRDLILRCPLIEELKIRWRCFDVAKLLHLHKLKYLRLDGLEFGDSLFKPDLWPKFACLKELVILDSFSGYEGRDARISSTSLERISIHAYTYGNVNLELDVPNIRMFEFEGKHLPGIKLKTTAMEWEARVHINCSSSCYRDNSSASRTWFQSLNKLVKMLGRSRLSLSIYLPCHTSDGDGYVGDGLDIPALENLTISASYIVSPGLLEALLWSCRPNFMSISGCCMFDMEKMNVEGFPKLRALLLSCRPNSISIQIHRLFDMEKMNVDGFQKLQSLPWTLLDASRGHEKFFRFKLK